MEPDVVFFDESADRSGIEGDPNQTLGKSKRCRETVRAFEVPSKVHFTCSTPAEAQQRLINFASEGQVIVVCYKTDSFFRFQPIKGCKYEEYMGKEKPKDVSVTNQLYDYILVTSFDGSDLLWQKTIPTRCAELGRSC
jgi:hypothetical protein